MTGSFSVFSVALRVLCDRFASLKVLAMTMKEAMR